MGKKIYDEIAKVAFDLHEKGGWVHGQDVHDWLEAERIVLANLEKGNEKEKSKNSSKAQAKKGKS